MLGFFRKYEKTFFLIVFAPAVLTMGISGVMYQMMQDAGADIETYYVYGEEIDQRKVAQEAHRGERLDDTLQRLAWEKLAEEQGVTVTSAELADAVKQAIKQPIVTEKIQEILEADPALKKNPQQYYQKYFALMQKYRDYEPDGEAYREWLKKRNLKALQFEAIIEAEERVRRLVDGAGQLASVDPDQLWAAFQDESHRRKLEIATLDAADYVPAKAEDVKENELRNYFNRNNKRYREQQRSKVHALHYPLAVARKEVKKELGTVKPADLKAFYQSHQGYFRDDKGELPKLESVTAEVTSRMLTEKALDRIQAALRKAEKGLMRPQDRNIANFARVSSDTVVEYFATDKMTLKEHLAKRPELDTEAFRYWFGRQIRHKPSDVLLAESGGWMFYLEDLSPERWRPFDKVKDAVTKDYLAVVEEDLQNRYDRNPAKYKMSARTVVDVLYVDYDRVAKKQKAPTDAELKTWMKRHADDFKGKEFKDVKAELEQGWRHDKAKAKAEELMDKVAGIIRKKRNAKPPRPVVLGDFTIDPELGQDRRLLKVKEDLELTAEELEKDEILGGVAGRISKMPEDKQNIPSGVEEMSEDKGKFIFVVEGKKKPGTRPFAEVKDEIRKEILTERGFARAQKVAEEVLDALRGLSAKELRKELKERGIKTRTTGFFSKTDKEVEGLDEPEQYVSRAFSLEPGGSYNDKVVRNEDKAIDLLRCVARQDAPEDEFSAKREDLRRSALNRVRLAQQKIWRRGRERAARSISEPHNTYAVNLYSGENQITKIKLRQIYLPADRETITSWLDKKAKSRIEDIQKELKGGAGFDNLAFQRSDEAFSSTRNGIIGFKNRGDLVKEYGSAFQDKVFQMKQGVISEPIKSDIGWHLVKVLGEKNGRRRIQHIVSMASEKFTPVDESVRKAARTKTRETMDKLAARLGSESLAYIAKDFKDNKDMAAEEKGSPFEVAELSPMHVYVNGLATGEIPVPVKIGTQWHVVISARAAERPNSRDTDQDFVAYHAAFDEVKRGAGAAKKAAEGFRLKMVEWRQNYTDAAGDRTEAPWSEVVRHFREAVKTASDADSAAKGGVLGVFKPEESVDGYGEGWWTKVRDLVAKGPGSVSGIIESDKGLHLVEIIEVIKPKPLEIDPNGTFEQSLIDNAGWR